MNPILSILLVFYSLLLCANTVISFLLWTGTKEKLFKLIIPIWGFSFLNFILQGIFQEPSVALLLSYGSYVIVSFSFDRFCLDLYKLKSSQKWMYYVSGALVVLSCVSWIVAHSFLISAYIMSVAISIPLFVAAYKIVKYDDQKRIEIKIFAALLVANGIHFLDYPILRFAPNGGVWGYSIALFILVLLSIFAPAFVVKEMSARYASELEHEVKIRTAELQELGKLHQALLGIVSHDLATPVTVLQVASDMLLKADPNEVSEADFNKHRQKIFSSVSSIKNILSQVRHLQSLSSGKQTLTLKWLDANSLVQEVLTVFEDKLKNKDLHINLENSVPNQSLIVADELMIKNQVLSNILSNAIKFSSKGSRIDIRLLEIDKWIHIEIQDHGIGIPADLLPHIFDFSVKTNRLGTENEKGTGFGLPVAKTCTEMMGGTLLVESHEADGTKNPQGTLFRIQLRSENINSIQSQVG